MTTHSSGSQRAFTRLASAVAAFGVTVPAGPLAWQAASPPATLQESAADALIAVSVQTHWLPSATLTRVVTNTGSAP